MPGTSRLFIILILSGLGFATATAQHNNSFIGIRLGYSLPMGQFASHEFGTGGYALLGKSLGGEAAWFINPKIGFGLDFSTNSFGFASVYYAEDMNENTPEYNSPVNMLSGPYKLKNFMGGVYYKAAFSKKFFSTFKLMGGVTEARTPDQFYGVEIFMQGNFYWWKTSTLDRTFAGLGGVSLEYRLNKNVSFLLQSDFTYAKASFTYYDTSGTLRYTNPMNLPVFKLQPGINICF